MQYVVEKKVLLGYTGVNGDVSALFFDKLIFSMSVKIHYLYSLFCKIFQYSFYWIQRIFGRPQIINLGDLKEEIGNLKEEIGNLKTGNSLKINIKTKLGSPSNCQKIVIKRRVPN